MEKLCKISKCIMNFRKFVGDFFSIKNYLCTECVVWHPQFYFIRTSRPDVRRFVINDICHEKCRYVFLKYDSQNY